ncbi:MAG: hypothetical protein QNJ90_16180 [Planctomycetota bacterium]|nr:hypothetical protein [Planctomycetota bacterium]
MRRSRCIALAAGLIAASAFFALVAGGPTAHAKSKKEAHLRYVPTWAEAVQQARMRNAIIFATFHKDN